MSGEIQGLHPSLENLLTVGRWVSPTFNGEHLPLLDLHSFTM